MIRRVLAALVFIAGGLLTWALLMFAKGYGASQAAMSAGAGSHVPNRDLLYICGFCSYFVVSAVGALFGTKPKTLKIVAVVAYGILLATFVAICASLGKGSGEGVLQEILTLSLIAAIYFAPWSVVWLVLLSRHEPNAPTQNT